MKPFTPVQERVLLGLSLFGLVGPNGFFLYHALTNPESVREALTNPVAQLIIAEAFFLMFLLAWLVNRVGFRSPGWLAFIFLSFLGSMACSAPAFLYLASRRARKSQPDDSRLNEKTSRSV
jgi:hypothetical protein